MSSGSCSISSALLIFTKMGQRKLTPKREKVTLQQVTLQACFVVFSIVIFSQLTLVEGAGVQKRESGDEVTYIATVENMNTTQNTTSVGAPGDSGGSDNTGAVVAAAIIAIVVCVAIVLGVYLFKRRRQSRMMDKEKKMQIQMSSARNAGIYQDLTVSVPTDDKPSSSPEHERLKAEDA